MSTTPTSPNAAPADLPSWQAGLLQLTFDDLSEAVVVADEHGRFVQFNPAAVEVLGMGPVEGTPDEWSDQYGLLLPDGRTPFPPADLPLARAIRGESSNDVEMFVRSAKRPDGIWLHGSGRPMRDATGKVKGGVVAFRDVSARKRAEAALRARLAQQAAAAELGRAALAGAGVSALLDQAVRLLAESLGVEFARVLELQPDGTVERHGGALTARSAPGRGATFLASLPVRTPQGDLPT